MEHRQHLREDRDSLPRGRGSLGELACEHRDDRACLDVWRGVERVNDEKDARRDGRGEHLRGDEGYGAEDASHPRRRDPFGRAVRCHCGEDRDDACREDRVDVRDCGSLKELKEIAQGFARNVHALAADGTDERHED